MTDSYYSSNNHMESVEDESAERLLSSYSSVSEIIGDPQVLPRVGDEYQAEIPPLIAKPHQFQLIIKPADSEVINNLHNPFPLGLPIPIMWTNSEVESINCTVEFENSEESQVTSIHEYANHKVETLDSELSNENMSLYSNLHPTAGSEQMDVDSVLPQKPKSKLDHADRGLCPFPGSLGKSWKTVECDSFLLGLYIFGKNLILVKKFVESKEMGDVLSFYYGKFYRSSGYCRWSECRKLRSRRCIHGQKIFTGWRQQELFSRLFACVSKECQNVLLELSKSFGEGKISFEEYVFTLKNKVGISVLIEAVGIGKGKQDLTGAAMEPVKPNHTLVVRPEIPVGKACSALSSAEIVKYLTGDFRLSKARSSDLFWEAVWPRLLARGWHSEQPKDHGFFGSKNSLVFLKPGIKKFSRRRHVKGNHYFDSVSDVLNKVASDPGLLELEIEEAKGSGDKEENSWDPPMKQDPDLKETKRQCYLKPRKSNSNRDLMKFTIVDTSWVQGATQSKVRELRSLPEEAASLCIPSSVSSDSEQESSDDLDDEAEEISTSNTAEHMADRGTCADSSDCVDIAPKFGVPNSSNPAIVAVENHESHNTSMVDEKRQRKTKKYNFNQKVKSGNSKYLASMTKQQGLADCINGESSCSIGNTYADRTVDEDISHCRSNSPDAFQIGPQNLSPASSLARGSPDRCNEGVLTENCMHREESLGKRQALIDLNIPQVSMDFEPEAPVTVETVQSGDNSCVNKPFLQSETTVQPEPLKIPNESVEVDQQPITSNRRQSTRNRPLTTKALEALECGFFSPKRKKKATESTSRRVRAKTVRPVVSATFRNGSDSSKMGDNLDGLCSTNSMVVQSQT